MSEDVIKTELNIMQSETKDMVISNDDQLQGAEILLTRVQTRIKRVGEFFKPMKAKADAAHKEICNKENEIIDAYKSVRGHIEPKVIYYRNEKDRKIREEELARQKEAQEAAEELRLNEAEVYEDKGDLLTRDAILDQPVYVPPVIIKNDTPKTKGVSKTITDWTYRVINTSLVPCEYMMWVLNDSLIKETVKARRKDANIPGIEPFPVSRLNVKAQ